MARALRRLVRFLGAVSLALVLGVVLVGMLPQPTQLASALIVADTPRHAGAIVVLSGGIQDEDTPSPGTALRVIHGVRLWKKGLAPILILTGGNLVDPTTPEAGVMARVALDLGVPASAMIVELESDRTVAQARAVARIVAARNIEDVLLVTSPVHSYRAVATFRKAGITVVSAPPGTQMVAASGIVLSPERIYHRLLTLSPVVYEGFAVALYRWNGWL